MVTTGGAWAWALGALWAVLDVDADVGGAVFGLPQRTARSRRRGDTPVSRGEGRSDTPGTVDGFAPCLLVVGTNVLGVPRERGQDSLCRARC